MISKEEVQHIAKLARINIKKEDDFSGELSKILDYIKKLKEVNIEGIEPTSHPFGIENVQREDIPKKKDSDLKKLAPDRERDYIKVKKILDQ